MSSRLEMLQVARLAPRLLRESGDLVLGFLRRQRHEDGGFRNRAGDSDLYYTVFGLEGLIALQAALPATETAAYLRRFGAGDGLDFVHLACLARCWAALRSDGLQPDEQTRCRIARQIEAHRAADGGYHPQPGSAEGTVYGCFIAAGACQDLGVPMPGPERVLPSLAALRAAGGGYANHRGAAEGSTPATAAAATLLRHLDAPLPPPDWLLARHHPGGGFCAGPSTPMPDLLSTATALHALAGLHAPLDLIREPCLDFLDTLWSTEGGFYGHWADEVLDCEYTYYGLLALGHLAV